MPDTPPTVEVAHDPEHDLVLGPVLDPAFEAELDRDVAALFRRAEKTRARTRRRTSPQAGARIGAAAVGVAAVGTAAALVATTLPGNVDLPAADLATSSLSGALAADARLAPSAAPVARPAPTTAPAPDLVDAKALVTSVQQAQRKISDQVAAAKATELAAQKAAAQKAAAQKAAAQKAAKAASDKAAAAKAAAARAAAATTSCGLDESGLGPVKPFVRTAAQLLGCAFGKPTMYGVAGRGGTSDHPSGKAVDFMVDRATGDTLAACALRNRDALGITYVIWRQRIDTGSGWEAMEDRGGITANHFDHVHVSFGSGGGAQRLTGC